MILCNEQSNCHCEEFASQKIVPFANYCFEWVECKHNLFMHVPHFLMCCIMVTLMVFNMHYNYEEKTTTIVFTLPSHWVFLSYICPPSIIFQKGDIWGSTPL
jgi:hypothetical protein